MKKLIFRKLISDLTILLLFLTFSIGLIVWTMQAVNYLDFVTEDGHSLKIYFMYSVYNFPKIIHRLTPFIFFITLFYLVIRYESRNELIIFWTHGINKFNFTNQIILFSLILTIFQIFIGSLVSPNFQYKARIFLKDSNIDFFSSLIKERKFINIVEGLTIFIDKKNEDESFSNIFIDDSSKNITKMIYAKKGIILEDGNQKTFKLFEGKVINKENSKINTFEFDQIDFNLTNYTSNTILVPKIQEISSKILLNCFLKLNNKIEIFSIKSDNLLCDVTLYEDLTQELLKRFYKPLYIPIIALLCSFLILSSKNNINYNYDKKKILFITFLTLIFSEVSLRYSASNMLLTKIYLIIPWLYFTVIYFRLIKKLKYV